MRGLVLLGLLLAAQASANTFYPGVVLGLQLFDARCADGPAVAVPGGLLWSESRVPVLYAANGRIRLGEYVPGTCARVDSGAAATRLSLVCEPIPGVGRYVLAARPYAISCVGSGCGVCAVPAAQDFR